MSKIISKQDCAHARTVQDIERKYSINNRFSKAEKLISDTRTEVNSDVTSVQTGIDSVKAAQERNDAKINTHREEIDTHTEQIANLTNAVAEKLNAEAVANIVTNEINNIKETEDDIDGWHYIKWKSGLVMCWKTFSKTVTSADWITWGAMYSAPLISGEALPFEIASNKREFATLHSAVDVMLISNDCSTTIGTYKVCSPISYTEDCTFQIDVMLVGVI